MKQETRGRKASIVNQKSDFAMDITAYGTDIYGWKRTKQELHIEKNRALNRILEIEQNEVIIERKEAEIIKRMIDESRQQQILYREFQEVVS